jgi:hypothetical protein
VTYGRTELIDAWLALRTASSGSDDDMFWQEQVRAVGAALGLTQGLGRCPSDTAPPQMWALAHLAETTAELLAGVRTPFEGYLEAPPEVIALSQQYGSNIAAAADQLRAELRQVLDATLAVVWGLPDSRRVTREQVPAQGVDPDQPPPPRDDDDLW